MIGHVAFVTDRMEETIRFYRDMFGYRHGFSLSDAEGNPWIEYLAGPDGDFIELFYAPAGVSVTAGSAYSHICIEISDIRNVIADADRLGIPLYKPLKEGLDRNLQAWFLDPNGLKVEVMQMSPDSPQSAIRQSLRTS